jgi:hypothetical protein
MKAWHRLRESRCALIKMATGAGKSAVILGLCHDAIRKDPTSRAILVAPTKPIILRSFDFMHREPVRVRFGDNPGEDVVEFVPSVVLMHEHGKTIDRLVNFLRESPRGSVSQRVVVCTHTALVQAYQRLQEQDPQGWKECWKNVHLFVDEAHHGKYTDSEGQEKYKDQIEEKAQNELGKIYHFYVEEQPGRLVLATATWMRSDRRAIVEDRRLFGPKARFDVYNMTMRQHLDSMSVLKKVKLGFVAGHPEKTIAKLYEQPSKRTLIYTPWTQSPLCGLPGTALEARKQGMVKRYMKAIGPVVQANGNTVTLQTRTGEKVEVLDLVCGAGPARDTKVKWMCDELDAGRNAFQVTFAMGLCQEGFDDPTLERMVVVGPRKSMTTTVQMMGRGLRDAKKQFEFLVNLPAPDRLADEDAVAEWITDSMGAIVAHLAMSVLWKVPELTLKHTDEERVALERLQDLGTVSEYMEGLRKSVRDASSADVLGLARQAIEDVEGSLLTTFQKDWIARELVKILSERSAEMRDAAGVGQNLDIQNDALDCLRIATVQITSQQLGAINKKRGIPWSRDLIVCYVRAHHSRTGEWPTANSGRIHGDGRVWGAANSWWHHRFNSGLKDLVAELQGLEQARYLSLSGIKDIIIESIGFGALPTVHGGPVKGHPGLQWSGVNSRLRNHFDVSLADLVSQLSPPVVVFTLTEFRSYLKFKNIYSERMYHSCRKAGTLDVKCPGSPKWAYDMTWRKIVGGRYLSKQHFLQQLPGLRQQVGIKSGQDYLRAHAAGKLPVGFPRNPKMTYGIEWHDVAGKTLKFSKNEFLRFWPIVRQRLRLDTHLTYRQAFLAGKLPPGFPPDPTVEYGVPWLLFVGKTRTMTKEEFWSLWPALRKRLHITSTSQYQSAKRAGKLPPGFPWNPHQTYKMSISVFLDKVYILSKQEFLKVWPIVRQRFNITTHVEYQKLVHSGKLPGFPSRPSGQYGLSMFQLTGNTRWAVRRQFERRLAA